MCIEEIPNAKQFVAVEENNLHDLSIAGIFEASLPNRTVLSVLIIHPYQSTKLFT